LTWKELSSYRTKRSNLKMPTLRETLKLAKNKIDLLSTIKRIIEI
jgi:hypothetical protein